MKIGIVGSEQKKFTSETEAKARALVRSLVSCASTVISGECHLGGVDTYAREIALELKVPFIPCPPMTQHWDGGFKQRNQKIAQLSDRVVCITLALLPPGYDGMQFPYCYHCKTNEHVKSGGCWTVKYARSIGKIGEVLVVR